ncbi:hypothetical protein MKJ04_15180 [Pontibacter sp. E15-1]|uniref:hypothetical protein n=1 Tax=Pontibacter sp. E15-1 TaxID=2919918 RepID=UPI001F4F9B83|nr:hypothetical protein [Pontibacter sp. E15-1]MCJ8166189.1 hypothetical protein [Pontibacter sp. E15-1]
MNGLDVKLIYPEDGHIHVDDDKRFSLHIEKDNDPAFENIGRINFELRSMKENSHFRITRNKVNPELHNEQEIRYTWRINRHLKEGFYEARAIIKTKDGHTHEDLTARVSAFQFDVLPPRERVKLAKDTEIGIRDPLFKKPVNVVLKETNRIDSADQLLWILIRNRTVKFDDYETFIDSVLCNDRDVPGRIKNAVYSQANRLPFHNVASYSLLKYATEYYLMQECGLVPAGLLNHGNWEKYKHIFNNADDLGRTSRTEINIAELRDDYLKQLTGSGEAGYSLPYLDIIRQKLKEVPLKKVHEISLDGYGPITVNNACYGILKSKLLGPCLLELIWSYWHEEGGLVQTMNAISRRFQNVRNGAARDPLANFNLDPLRPMNNLLWGYIEDERNRLSISRRNLEYQYEYGISLIGKAVPQVSVAEHRTDFIRAFHNLLKSCIEFYNQANFTTVIPDGFPLLNHLREVHLLLAEGAHNQYGDLPWTSRIEMLIQQWLLSRPEMREFIGGRIMVPYAEPWMDKVDTMKTLQGWSSTNITHFHDLGVFGEQLLLSVRFGNWNASAGVGATNAANWAHYWRNEVQRYVHAYSAVTGVDLAAEPSEARGQTPTMEDRYLPPAILIQKQAGIQKSRQQYALQASMGRPGILQNSPAGAMPALPATPSGTQKKLNG